jgi:hypothetical protein
MITKRFSNRRPVLTVGLAAVLFFTGGMAGTLPRVAVTSPEELVLRYKMPAGQVLRYQDTAETREIQEVMGQTNETVATSKKTQSFLGKGQKEGNHLLGVTIDDWTMTVLSMQGDLSPDLKSVLGKSFDMVLSPLGLEVDVSGAESITFMMWGGTQNLAAGFKIFFPDLPDKPVKVGDSWPSSFLIEDKSGASNRRTDIQSVNTFEGLETMDGMECARITSKLTGSISGTGNLQGLDLLFAGTVKGTDVWYFAPKEGIYVKSTTDVVSEITITVSGAQNMTVPTTQKRKGEVKLVGR